jgi:hypothetical protein
MTGALDEPTLYDVLQVSPAAEPEVVEAAYRRLAQKYHPDVSSEPASAERMAEINAAYQVLGDAASRAEYDDAIGLYDDASPDQLQLADPVAANSMALATRRAGLATATEATVARPANWPSRIGLAAILLVGLILAAYFLSEPRSEAVDLANSQATNVALANTGLTVQVLRDDLVAAQAQRQVAESAAAQVVAAALVTREALGTATSDGARLAQTRRAALLDEATRQVALVEATSEAIATQSASEAQALVLARQAATSEALASAASREAELAQARDAASAAEARAAEANRQAEALAAEAAALEAARQAQVAAVEPAPVAPPPPQAPARAEAPVVACADSNQVEIAWIFLQPQPRGPSVEYFGQARVQNSCDHPIRIQLGFAARGADGSVVLMGQTQPLLLGPGQAGEVNDSIGFRPRADITSFDVSPSIVDARGS